jgi:hypothetical protein
MAEAKSRSNLATSMKLSFPLMAWVSTGVVSGTLEAQEAGVFNNVHDAKNEFH